MATLKLNHDNAFGVKKLGDWHRAFRLIKGLPMDVKMGYLAGQQIAMKKLERIVKDHLVRQDLPWAPLNREYKARKKHPDMTLYESGLYYKSISVFREGNTFNVGVKKGISYRNKKSGQNTQAHIVASLHEHGGTVWLNRRLPARPLWGPSIREMGGAAGIRNYVLAAIAYKLGSKGWKVNKGNFSSYGK